MKHLLRALTLSAFVLFALPAIAAAATGVTPPTLTGQAEVGQQLTCSPGTATGTSPGDTVEPTGFTFTYSGGGAVAGTPTFDTYTPVAGDLGKQIVCTETVEDTNDATTASNASSPSAPVAPEASLNVTRYSNAVSGNIGENVAGVAVTVGLGRSDGTTSSVGVPNFVQVASGTATTDANGAWSLSLAPAHGFASGDELTTQYAVGSAPSTTTVPGNFNYVDGDVPFEGISSRISANGATITTPSLTFGDCASLQYSISRGGAAPTSVTATANPTTGQCGFSPSPALTDADSVFAFFTSESTNQPSGVAANVQTGDEIGLLGVNGGPPTCSADLVFGTVVCGPLNAGSFAVSVNGGTPVTLATQTVNATPGVPASGETIGTATLSGLAAGQTLALNETGPTQVTDITDLKIGALQVHTDVNRNFTATCQPLEPYASSFCPSNGQLSLTSLQSQAGTTSELDDLSGGSTEVNQPFVDDLIPTGSDEIAGGGTVTSYADLFGTVPGLLADNVPSFTYSSAQVLAATKSVQLAVIPHANTVTGTPVFNQPMTASTDPVGPFETVGVPGLTPGRYFATWTLTDSNGDTSVSSDQFAVQAGGGTGPAGAAGATGPAGPAGAPGPAGKNGTNGTNGKNGTNGTNGKNGTSELAKCTLQKRKKTTGKGKHKKTVTVTHTVCKVSVIKPGTHVVSVRISRGHSVFATGSAAVQGRSAQVRMHNRRTMSAGRYLVTVASINGKRVTVTRSTLTVR